MLVALEIFVAVEVVAHEFSYQGILGGSSA
jgi:hypothetical protein